MSMPIYQEENAKHLIRLSRKLCSTVQELHFSPPVHTVYNPLQYARAPWETYIKRYATTKKHAVFLGMNPGPWGMAQTGIPFGEISAVHNWMDIHSDVQQPNILHPKRPILGFACTRSEVSGRRLWGLMQQRFGTPKAFFQNHIVLNYCPLSFMQASGANITPAILRKQETEHLFAACDSFLIETLILLQPKFVVGVGAFAAQQLARSIAKSNHYTHTPPPAIVQILHPSPASPAANRGWAETAAQQLIEAEVW